MNAKSTKLYTETLLAMYKKTLTPKMFKWMDSKISGRGFIAWAKENGYTIIPVNKKED